MKVTQPIFRVLSYQHPISHLRFFSTKKQLNPSIGRLLKNIKNALTSPTNLSEGEQEKLVHDLKVSLKKKMQKEKMQKEISSGFMPNGEPAGSTDPVMLMKLWAMFRNSTSTIEIIEAGMGKPTFPIHRKTAQAALDYWMNIVAKSNEMNTCLEVDPDLSNSSITKIAETNGGAIDYDNPQGNLGARKLLAKAVSKWYGIEMTEENILFTVGGAFAIHACLQMMKNEFPYSYIVTPAPYYSLYGQAANKLHLIDVMRNPGYQLTAQSLQESLEEAKRLKYSICGLIICDPNNPLSTVISSSEWQRIANVLRLHPHFLIILDEAYAEMQLDGQKYVSLLTIAPDLKERMIIIRSGTKGMSAAGERLCSVFIFNRALMQKMMQIAINTYGHPPVSSQIIYAKAFTSLTSETLAITARYYQKQVDYVVNALKRMGAEMPDTQYVPKGTFYVLCNLGDLYGLSIHKEAVKALGKKEKTITDEDIAYNLLFQDSIMIAPLSYYGAANTAGFFRITCSVGLTKLQILMERLARRLCVAREIAQGKLLSQLMLRLEQIKIKNTLTFFQFLLQIKSNVDSCRVTDVFLKAKNLRAANQSLKLIQSQLDQYIASITTHFSLLGDSMKLKFDLSAHKEWATHVFAVFEQEAFEKWRSQIGHDYGAEDQLYFSRLTLEEKLNFVPWEKYIEMQLQPQSVLTQSHDPEILMPIYNYG